MKSGPRAVALAALLMSASIAVAQVTKEKVAPDRLAAPDAFTGDTRSAAIFTELGKVLTSPRCVNCHPAGDKPHQGDTGRPHQPPVTRGADGFGTASMRCSSCHPKENFDPARMPGHEMWHLAPREMAWEGKTLREICLQVKDRERNGGREPHDLIEHIGDDTLVGWAWKPGPGRTPAPGTQRQAKALVQAWVDTGAGCPN